MSTPDVRTTFEFASSIVDDVAYFDTWNRFRAPRGGYTAYFREGGRVTLIREGDGLHFNAIGYTIVTRRSRSSPSRSSGCLLARSRRTSSSSPGDRHVGDLLHRGRHVLLAVLDLREPSVQVVVVRLHVERAVPGEVEEDHALLARLARRVRLVDRAAPRGPTPGPARSVANRTAASNTAFCE